MFLPPRPKRPLWFERHFNSRNGEKWVLQDFGKQSLAELESNDHGRQVAQRGVQVVGAVERNAEALDFGAQLSKSAE